MKLNEIQRPANSRQKRKRLGKGDGSGYGHTAARGMNGQKSRSGGGIPNWFEGGQMPIHRRLPQKGFTNIFKQQYRIVSLNDIAKLDDAMIDIPALEKAGLIASCKSRVLPVKVLANTDNTFESKKIIKANAFSKKAVEIIERVGGKAEVL